MYQNPKRMFMVEVLLMIGGVVVFIFGVAISGIGGNATVAAVVLNGGMLLLLLAGAIASVIFLIRRWLDHDNHKPVGLYVLNVIVGVAVFAFFLVFYLVIVLAISTIVLPIV